MVSSQLFYCVNKHRLINLCFTLIDLYICGWSGVLPLVFFIATEKIYGYTDETYTYGKSSSVTFYKLGDTTYCTIKEIGCEEDEDEGVYPFEKSRYITFTLPPEPKEEKINGETDVKID